MRFAVALALIVLAAPATAREKLVHVPFVGCPSDGQTGPIPAPRPHQTPAIAASAAAKLAFYATDYSMVLAPRGWHCVGLYGASGQSLIVTPERHQAEEFFAREPVAIHGPAVQMSVSVGGTSGRLSVIPAIERYFPFYRPFAVEARKLDDDASPPSRPWRSDVIKRQTRNYVRFITPAGQDGEGTHSLLLRGTLPIHGFRMIIGDVEEPDLVSATVRLPPDQAGLIDIILAEAAK